MTFKKVLSFFLTGATALSMTTAALAADDTPIMLRPMWRRRTGMRRRCAMSWNMT